MNKLIVLTAVCTIALFTSCAQKIDASKVPAPVKESFTKQFPGVTAKWEKENGKYEALFKQEGKEMTVTFEADGTRIESEIEIPVAELPEAVKNYIKINYGGATIKEAAKITLAGGKVEYEAEVKGKVIIFDMDGNFVKEVGD